MAIAPPSSTAGIDTLAWKDLNPLSSLVKHAYYRIMNFNDSKPDFPWSKIWSWKGPEKLKIHMWKLSHGKILTNKRSAMWGLGSDRCHHCKDKVESILHVLRDCPIALDIWTNFRCPTLPSWFFTEQDQSIWLKNNLMFLSNNTKEWTDFFFIACWLLWIWRNKAIHEEDFRKPDDGVKDILNYSMDIHIALQKPLLRINSGVFAESSSFWVRPPSPWSKLNVDGAVGLGKAACGGLVRDLEGNWSGGFSSFLGCCSPL